MDLKALVTELGQVTSRYGAIVKEHDGKEIPADKLAELKRLHDRGMELKGQIELAQAGELERKDMDGLKTFLDKPVPGAPMPTGPTSGNEGMKALTARGWEIKGGVVHIPSSRGMVAMWPEEVLFGPIPTGEKEASAAEFFRTTRAALQPGYRAAFKQFLWNVAKFHSPSMAFSQLSGAEQKALSEGTDTAGGFLVPPEYQAEMLVRKAQRSVMRRYATIQPCSRDILRFPRVSAASATQSGLAAGGASVFSSGFVGSWVGETPAFTDTDPAFGTFDIAIKKVRAATKLSNDFIADSVVDVLAFLSKNGGENLGLVEDQGYISGDGSALRPKGILNSGASTVDVEGSTANLIINTTAAAGTAPKIIDLLYAVPPQYVDAAVWLMTRTSEGKTRKLVDAQGRFHWPLQDSTGAGLGAGKAQAYGGRTLAQYPVENSAFMPDDGTDANKVYIFGDLSAYVIGDRSQISVKVLNERFADTDQTGIILFARVGGDTWNPDAIRFGIV